MNYPIIKNFEEETLAILNNILSPRISKKLTGEHTLTFTAIIEELKTDYIHYDNFIEMENELYQIVQYKKQRTNDNKLIIDVTCEHVSYALLDEELPTGFTYGGNINTALDTLLQGTNFTRGTVDYTGTVTITNSDKTNKRSILLNEFVQATNMEVEFTNYSVNVVQQIGSDNGVQIRLGKNLKGITVTVDNTKKDEQGNPSISYEIDFVELDTLDEFKGLETISLGDTIKIIDEGLGVDIQMRVIEYEYDPIKKINSRIVLGNVIEDITDKNIAMEKSISNHENRITTTEFKVTDDAIISTVTQSEEYQGNVTNLQSQITQNAESINLKVSKNNVVSEINQTAEEITIQANKIGLLGETNIPDLTANKIRGGTLTLGGNGNEYGKLILLNVNNEEIGSIVGDNTEVTASFSKLSVDEIIGNNIISTQTNKDIYVNSSTGSDNNSGTSGSPFKTIQKAVDSLGKYLTDNVYIYCTGTFIDDIYISGFIGGGTLYLKLQTSIVKGSVNVLNCSAYIRVEGTSDASKATIEATSSTTPLYVGRSQYVFVRYIKANAKQLATYAAFAYGNANVIFETCSLTNATHSGVAVQHGRAYLYNCKGKSTQYGAYVLGGAFAGFDGTVPNGATAWNSTLSSAESRYGTVTPTDDTYDGTPPATLQTVTYNATASRSWGTSYGWRTDNTKVYEGNYGYGNYKGCIFFGSQFNNLQGKDIQSAKLYIKRSSSGGSSSKQPINFYGHNYQSQPAGEPSLGTGYGELVSLGWGESTAVNMPSSFISGVEGGTVDGIAIYQSDGSPYVILEGVSNYTIKIVFTYYN